jgi:disulfide bond formation protein DsbB
MPDTTNSIGIDDHEEAIAIGWAERLAIHLGASSRHIALLAAWLATAGSLFMSEVLGWQPCLLCWYQRILMYPLALILPIGIIRRDRGLHLYALPLALLGAPISLYHYLLIKTNLFPPPPCTVGAPCTVDYIDWFGFINIPFMALTAFLIISVTMGASALLAEPEELDARADRETGDGGESEEAAAGLGMSGIAVFVIIALVLVAFIAASALIG